ncbi:MAG TPA: DsbA family protein [Xanthobacteraceae bacterium]|nr:DsbA family protein [Xanthobacteraceae bacterium]
MMKTLIGVSAAALVMLALPVTAQEFSAPQKSEIERIIKDYIVSHPEVLQEAIAELDKRQAAADLEKAKTAVADNAETLFNSNRHVVLGNPKGDVTLVEFFDYNCGFCKRALPDMLELLKDDPRLKIILKEFPVLGPGSVEAAKVAVAVRMQDKTGKKYLDFHQKLLGGRGQADKAHALAVAKEVGMDMKRIDADMASEEVKVSLDESLKLAETLGLNGTPSYIIGTDVVVGAVGLDALRTKVSTARCGKAVC